MNKEDFQNLDPKALDHFFQKTGKGCQLFEGDQEELGFPFKPVSKDMVIFYPGSFSPWHKGHRECLKLLSNTISSEEDKLHSSIVVVPDYNPWKNVRDTDLKEEVLSVWNSLEELQKDFNLNFHLYLGFLFVKKKNPTWDWMRKLKQKRKWILMGEDSFLALDQWFEAEKLLKILEGIFVVPREAPPAKVSEQLEKVKGLAGDLKVVFLDHHKYEKFSSTYLREND